MKLRKRRAYGAGVAILAAAALTLPPAAQAEGSWTGSFRSIVPGFDTRDWYDSNSDGTKTTLSIRSCRQDSGNPFTNLVWQLTYPRSGLVPDENHGRKIVYCKNYGVTPWGDMKSGHWRFGYIEANGGQDYYFSSNSIRVDY